ncbi:MAG: ROK family protein [Verrucomicrobia bacterium]|nr:ROK family protein [Verrucomicrobiota bacterium]MBI3867007.1 ROK family protein [Verrucomicrobiota bacterium]
MSLPLIEGCAMGIDVGGTKIAAGLVSFPDAKVLARIQRPTLPGRGGDASLGDLVEVYAALELEAVRLGVRPSACGLGLPELVTSDGRIVSNAILGWQRSPVRSALSSNRPCFIEADVRAGALAEAYFGAGRALSSFLYITVGTGISCCLVIDGVPYTGTLGLTGTMASNPMFCDGDDGRPRRGLPLENYSAGPALVTRLNHLSPGAADSGHEVLALAASGHATAAHVVVSAAELLGCSIGHLVNTLDPAAVVVGGGLGIAGGLYWDAMVKAAREQIWSEFHRSLPIHTAQTGVDAGLIGAALRALRLSQSTPPDALRS